VGRLPTSLQRETNSNVEASVKLFNDTLQWAGRKATPEHTVILITLNYSIQIKQKKTRKDEDSAKLGTDSEHQKA
jgi:hypothetical protein